MSAPDAAFDPVLDRARQLVETAELVARDLHRERGWRRAARAEADRAISLADEMQALLDETQALAADLAGLVYAEHVTTPCGDANCAHVELLDRSRALLDPPRPAAEAGP